MAYQPQQHQQSPANYQQPLYIPYHKQSKKNLALIMFLVSWISGILAVMFASSLIGFCVALPLLVLAFVAHILGFVFLAQIKEDMLP